MPTSGRSTVRYDTGQPVAERNVIVRMLVLAKVEFDGYIARVGVVFTVRIVLFVEWFAVLIGLQVEFG